MAEPRLRRKRVQSTYPEHKATGSACRHIPTLAGIAKRSTSAWS